MNNTLLKGLAVLELLSHSKEPLSLTQIGAELGMVKSNVHRLMQALVETRYVLRHEESGRYTASIRLWELGSAVLSRLDLRRHAETQMNALQETTGESVHLSVLDRGEVVYVHKVESLNPVRAYTQIGGRVPAYCVATGKALLACGSDEMLQAIAGALKPHTVHTIVDPALFLKEMRKVRMQGYAVNRGEWREAVWGVAAPIMGARGAAIAAIGVSGPGERFRKRSLSGIAEMVLAAAVEISEALGGTPRNDVLLQLGKRKGAGTA
ncbi:MAG TPA: IclR family transcriptional regulator [Pseudorhodoferax sp.]|jgi:DNA-binding IclR family transcriptional regulator|nr:IclR family transcriptional regulator [Pseudorhodoferax sp.]